MAVLHAGRRPRRRCAAAATRYSDRGTPPVAVVPYWGSTTTARSMSISNCPPQEPQGNAPTTPSPQVPLVAHVLWLVHRRAAQAPKSSTTGASVRGPCRTAAAPPSLSWIAPGSSELQLCFTGHWPSAPLPLALPLGDVVRLRLLRGSDVRGALGVGNIWPRPNSGIRCDPAQGSPRPPQRPLAVAVRRGLGPPAARHCDVVPGLRVCRPANVA